MTIQANCFYKIRVSGQVREAAKKSSSTNGQAIKRGGGVPVKAGPLRKKVLFLNLFFLICCHDNYFTLDNLSKYGHITLKFVGRYFYLVVTIFSKK